jgi:hypothetical protein
MTLKLDPAGRLGSCPSGSRPAFVSRSFYGEVRHARGVSHPNVCRVYDVRRSKGGTFSRWSTSMGRTRLAAAA